MKKTVLSILFTIFVFISTGVLHSQILFDKKYSGGMTTLYGDVVSDGFIFAGHIYSEGTGFDAALTKIDSLGNVIWSYKYVGSGSQDGFRKVRVTRDNNYLLAGYTNSFSEDSYWNYMVAKVDSAGNMLWAREIGGLFAEEAWDILETVDSSYFAVGYSKSFGDSGGDIVAVKLSSDGDIIWKKVFGTPQGDWVYSMTESRDGGFILTGNSYNGSKYIVSLIKLDKNGEILWSTFFNSSGYGNDYGYEVKEAEDGNIFLTGILNIMGENRTCLIKTDSAGILLWARIYGGFFGDTGFSFEFSVDGGFIIGGSSNNFLGEVKPTLMKLDKDANVDWMRIFGDYEQGEIRQVKLTHDGTYIAGGFIYDGYPNSKIYLVKTDEIGHTYCNSTLFQPACSDVMISNVELPFDTSESPEFVSIEFARDTISLSASNTCNCPATVEMKEFIPLVQDNKVTIEWETKSESNNTGFNVLRNNEVVGHIEGNGTTSSNHTYSYTDMPQQQGKYTYIINQTAGDGTVEVVGEANIEVTKVTLDVEDNHIPDIYNLYQNYPNPFNPVTSINYSIPEKAFVTLKIYDVLGKELNVLVNEEQSPGDYNISFDGTILASGIYYYELKANSFKAIKKMTLIK